MFRKNRQSTFAHGQPIRPMIENFEERQFLSASMGLAAGAMARAKGPAASNARLENTCRTATVVSTDTGAKTITIATTSRSGTTTDTTYTLSPTATIPANGATAALGQLVAGTSVKFVTDAASPTTVTSVTAIGKQADGRVTAVDAAAGAITLTSKKDGVATTYNVSGAAVTVNGAAGTLAGIAVGAEVAIRYSALDSVRIVAVAIK